MDNQDLVIENKNYKTLQEFQFDVLYY